MEVRRSRQLPMRIDFLAPCRDSISSCVWVQIWPRITSYESEYSHRLTSQYQDSSPGEILSLTKFLSAAFPRLCLRCRVKSMAQRPAAYQNMDAAKVQRFSTNVLVSDPVTSLIQGDASFTRADAFIGDNSNFQQDLFDMVCSCLPGQFVFTNQRTL
jgi:hypothetical protein